MSEIDIMRAIQVHLSRQGHRVFRNNTAVGWVGQVVGRTSEHITLRNARVLHAGLCVGSSDLVGFTSSGIFLAIEVKSATGCSTPEQRQFIATVRQFGGRAGIARSPEDANAIANGTPRE